MHRLRGQGESKIDPAATSPFKLDVELSVAM
jgi:hypothetical protein